MFVAIRPWEKDEDYKNLIQNLNPPPPPGSENLWELQFCKWWGWNWVKKKEVVEEPMQKSVAPRRLEGKKPEKKPIKHLCQTLCFKKKKGQKPLQDRYNTPSNSVIENPKNVNNDPSNSITEVDNKQVQTSGNKPKTYSDADERSDLMIERDIEEQIVREVRGELHTQPKAEMKKKRPEKEWSTSSTEECCPCKDRNKGRSSTEESVEYINITCCPCRHSREPPAIKKNTNEKFTQDTQPQCLCTSTQTEVKEKKHKRKRICVVCCCRCDQNNPQTCPQITNTNMCPCCSCDNIRRREPTEKTKRNCPFEPAPRPKAVEEDFYKKEVPKLGDKPVTTYQASVEQSSPFEKEPPKKETSKKPTRVRRKFEPLYVTGMPIDTMLYYNKPMTKFGIPSQSYSWIHATKSDIWDQFSHSRTNQEFPSPVSGKTYNISPIKLREPELEYPGLLNPISVEDELQYIKQIESGIKIDLKSRIMLDAVCDAILASDKEPDVSSSIFLNELTYPSNVTQTECVIDDLYKSERKSTCSKLNQTVLEEFCADLTNRASKSKVNCETNTNELDLNLDNQEINSLRDYLNVRSPQTYAMENSYRRIHSPCISLNYNSHRECLTSNTNKGPYKLLDYGIQPVTTKKPSIFTRTKLLPTSKRSASPNPRVRDVKKVKLGEPSPLANFNNTNVSDIFKKIDEIILRSKVNNEEIQSVLNNIPKRTFQFFTSWEVSNLMNQNSSLTNANQKDSGTLCVNTCEDKKEKHEKDKKISQVKKKKICYRPSMIPKRVTDSKFNKRNVN